MDHPQHDTLFAQVIEYGRKAHGTQERKYVGGPYFDNHCIPVAELVRGYGCSDDMIIAALLHDVLEDTPVSPGELSEFLCELPKTYSWIDPADVLNLVLQLTDEFTKERYPTLNRSERKRLESMRWHHATTSAAQTIKYCDMIHNTQSIVEHDPNFAKVYLGEIAHKVSGMTKGMSKPYNDLIAIIRKYHHGEVASQIELLQKNGYL